MFGRARYSSGRFGGVRPLTGRGAAAKTPQQDCRVAPNGSRWIYRPLSGLLEACSIISVRLCLDLTGNHPVRLPAAFIHPPLRTHFRILTPDAPRTRQLLLLSVSMVKWAGSDVSPSS